MKKVISLLLAVVLAGTAFAAAAPKKDTAKQEKAKEKAKASFVIVVDETYAAGGEDKGLTTGLAGFLEVEPEVTLVPYSTAKADAKLAGLDYSFLPLYLVKKTPEIRSKLEQHISYGYVLENDEYLIFPHSTRQGVYTTKTAKPGIMEIFVMSQCPYGVMAEGAVIQGQKDGKSPKANDVRIRYIVDYNDARGFSSMHGSGEWEEDVRQLLIAKYYPTKFWKYLEIRNKDYRSSRWDKAMEDAGINAKKIMKKFDTEGLELLKQEAAYGKEYGVNASPTFLWEGKVQLDFGTASQIEGFEFLNPKAPSGNQAAAPAPAGSC